jgi:hypothetical protein
MFCRPDKHSASGNTAVHCRMRRIALSGLQKLILLLAHEVEQRVRSPEIVHLCTSRHTESHFYIDSWLLLTEVDC